MDKNLKDTPTICFLAKMWSEVIIWSFHNTWYQYGSFPVTMTLKKACSRSNFEKRLGAMDSWESGEGTSSSYIIQKKFRKLFLRSLIKYLFTCYDSYSFESWFITLYSEEIIERLKVEKNWRSEAIFGESDRISWCNRNCKSRSEKTCQSQVWLVLKFRH